MLRTLMVLLGGGLLAGLPAVAGAPQLARPIAPHGPETALFLDGRSCMACHNGLLTPDGEDVSIGVAWRATMMANSSRDPYWHAGVRRETIDHPSAAAAIEHECSTCHMPMSHVLSTRAGQRSPVFAHLPVAAAATPEAQLAADGVSCTVCHQIESQGFGEKASFTGRFVISPAMPAGGRPMYGPYDVDRGRVALMRSATGFQPAPGLHVQQSELCATCHTLYTHALGPGGEVLGELPEQVPYLEWRHSAFRHERSCQACHMRVVTAPMPIASVLGQPREGFSRHDFLGGNFFMLRLLAKHGRELGVVALPQELDAAALRTVEHLRTETARLTIARVSRGDGRLRVDVEVTNLGGHKLPTAYPSRRVWVRLIVRDREGAPIFESGALRADGAIAGNDNDEDAGRFEPHHLEITSPDAVQIYESIMVDRTGAVTTGLLSGLRYAKDNRLLPRGFDKAGAPADIAVLGDAAADRDFAAPGDRLRYTVTLPGGRDPADVVAELWYQPIGFRWAENLRAYDAPEPQQFLRYFDGMRAASAAMLASTRAAIP